MEVQINLLGNVYDDRFGPSFGGAVWDDQGLAPTLKTTASASQQHVIVRKENMKEPKIVASRGRNPNDPADRTTGAPMEQRLEIQLENIANTLTSVQKDNMVLEERGYDHMADEQTEYVIRKLTPKECFRLMGVKDEDYEKLTASNTQKYKQAGNSIVVDVLMGIFENMFVKDCKKSSLF